MCHSYGIDKCNLKIYQSYTKNKEKCVSNFTHHDLSMIKGKHTFESEKLQVDYLTFNIKNSVNNVQKIARYFNNIYKFNCYYYDKKLGIKSKKSVHFMV